MVLHVMYIMCNFAHTIKKNKNMDYIETRDLLQVEITKQLGETEFGQKASYEYVVTFNWGLLTRNLLYTLEEEAEELGGCYDWDFEEFVMPSREAAEEMKERIITICM